MSDNRIIVVEDNPPMAKALERLLNREGYQVALASSGIELRRLYRTQGADLVLLDLNLGDEDGIDIARELVLGTDVAVIIVSGRVDLEDRLLGLDVGADDYIMKPYEPLELLARVRVALRRKTAAVPTTVPIRLGSCLIDPEHAHITHEPSGKIVRLTGTETRILATLMHEHGRAVSRERLLNRETVQPTDRTVDVHIGHIRQKLAEAGVDDLSIVAVRGIGYRLNKN